MFKASIFALILQCGTTAPATIITWYTPTVGLGCRTLGYILYATTATLILLLTIISTILARISETCVGPSVAVKGLTAFIAITLRRLVLFLAFVNAMWLVALSCLQFSNSFESCYCKGDLGEGANTYVIISYEGWISVMKNSRIAATIFAMASMAIYMFFLWVVTLSSFPDPEKIDDSL